MSTGTPTDLAFGASNGLPRKVRDHLAGRAQAVRSRDLGRVFDLSDPGPADPGGYDAVISVSELVCFGDLPAALGSLSRLLRPGGEMWLLEPIGRPGIWASVLSWLWSASPSVTGLNLCRDVPAAVRATGMTITDIERFTMPEAPWPLRRFAQLRATWIEPSA